MGLSRKSAREVVGLYLEAWIKQDSDLIASIFTENATYQEGVQRPVIVGRQGIRQYWEVKVAREQANIQCKLLDLIVDGTTVVAEWEAEFDDLPLSVRKRIVEVAILDFEGTRISRLREYWNSQVVEPDFAGAASAMPNSVSAWLDKSAQSEIEEHGSVGV